jgi:hypothetical protein
MNASEGRVLQKLILVAILQRTCFKFVWIRAAWAILKAATRAEDLGRGTN